MELYTWKRSMVALPAQGTEHQPASPLHQHMTEAAMAPARRALACRPRSSRQHGAGLMGSQRGARKCVSFRQRCSDCGNSLQRFSRGSRLESAPQIW